MAKLKGISVYGWVSMPFKFEGAKRRSVAEQGLEKIKPFCDEISVNENEDILASLPKDTKMLDALELVNQQAYLFISDNLKK